MARGGSWAVGFHGGRTAAVGFHGSSSVGIWRSSRRFFALQGGFRGSCWLGASEWAGTAAPLAVVDFPDVVAGPHGSASGGGRRRGLSLSLSVVFVLFVLF